MPAPLTYFHYPIGPCCCRRLGYTGPHTHFSVLRLLKKSIVIWTKNNQFADTRSVHRQLSCIMIHAFNCRVKFYLSILRSFTVAGYPRSPAVLASSRWWQVASTINALPKASRNCRWINQMRLIVYEVCFTLVSSTQRYFSFIYFRYADFGMCKNHEVVTQRILSLCNSWRQSSAAWRFLCVYQQVIKV